MNNNSHNPFANNKLFKNLNNHNAKKTLKNAAVAAVANTGRKVGEMSTTSKILLGLIIVAIIAALVTIYFLNKRHGRIAGLEFSVFMNAKTPHDATIAFDSPSPLPLTVAGGPQTYSLWFYMDARDGWATDDLRHIMHIEDQGKTWTPGPKLNNHCISSPSVLMSPGIFLHPTINRLIVKFAKTSDIAAVQECVPVDDLRFNEWQNIIVVIANNTLTIYLNGKVVKTHVIADQSLLSNGERFLHLCNGGGFNGSIAYVQYYERELTVDDINYLYKADAKDFAHATGKPSESEDMVLYVESQ